MSSAPAATQPNPLALVKLKRSLLSFTSEARIIENIYETLQAQGDLSALKHDLELLQYICRLIETAASDYRGPRKLEKKKVAISVITKMYPDLNNNADLARIDSAIEFLWSNNRIRGVSRFTRTVSNIGSFLARKLL